MSVPTVTTVTLVTTTTVPLTTTASATTAMLVSAPGMFPHQNSALISSVGQSAVGNVARVPVKSRAQAPAIVVTVPATVAPATKVIGAHSHRAMRPMTHAQSAVSHNHSAVAPKGNVLPGQRK